MGKAAGDAVEHLHAHVVGAGVEVGLHAGDDGVLVAPRHDGVDELVAAAVAEVVVAPAEAAQVVRVVGQA